MQESLLHPETACPTGMDATSQLKAALIFSIFKQKCSPRDGREEGTKKGLSPANPPEITSFTHLLDVG